MGKITIYLDDELEAKMRKAANALNISKNKWIVSLIKAKIENKWPVSVKKLAGAWQDLPLSSEIRNINNNEDAREI